jgi:hypothetical protein
LFRGIKKDATVELVESDFKPDEIVASTLLERSTKKVGETLNRLRASETDLERQIATLTEELRQTRVAITAFDAAGAILVGSQEPAKPPTATANIGRLVPRTGEGDHP